MAYIVYCTIVFLFALYSFLIGEIPFFDKFTPVFFVITGVWYMLKNRRDSLFCPELLFFIFGFINSFFTLIVTDIPLTTARYYDLFSDIDLHKSNCLTIICLSAFAIGIELANIHYNKSAKKKASIGFYGIPTSVVPQLNAFTFIVVAYLFFTGLYRAAFKYSHISSGGESTFYLLYNVITALLLVSSICEFVRLSGLSNRYSYKSQLSFFLHNVNKPYLALIIFVTLFLLLTGNRNDMMMILLPLVILYHFLIKKFENKKFLTYFGSGFCLMFFIGMTRTGEFDGRSVADSISVYYALRDFAAANIDQLFLIQYTDINGTAGLEFGFKVIAASIPFLSGILIGGEGFEDAAFKNSNKLTTSMMNEGGSGMGTSLFGDLYFCGGLIFAIIYMLMLGYFISKTYTKLSKGESVGVVAIIFFCIFFSNMIYVLRSTWYAMFRPIGFALTIVTLVYIIGRTNKSYT